MYAKFPPYVGLGHVRSFVRHAGQLDRRGIGFLLHRHTAEPLRSRCAMVTSFSLKYKSQYPKNRSVHQLLGCPHFAGFAICRGSLRFVFVLRLMQCQRRLQISRVKNISSVFEISGAMLRPAPPYGGLLARRNADPKFVVVCRCNEVNGTNISRIEKSNFTRTSGPISSTSIIRHQLLPKAAITVKRVSRLKW